MCISTYRILHKHFHYPPIKKRQLTKLETFVIVITNYQIDTQTYCMSFVTYRVHLNTKSNIDFINFEVPSFELGSTMVAFQ